MMMIFFWLALSLVVAVFAAQHGRSFLGWFGLAAGIIPTLAFFVVLWGVIA